MTRRRAVLRFAALFVAVFGVLTIVDTVRAWGDGSICWQGVIHEFDDEASYDAFLAIHPDAIAGACTTTTIGEQPSATPPTPTTSAPTTPSSAPSTTGAPQATSPPPSSVSVPPSTPSSATVPIPPGSCLATGNCPTTVDETIPTPTYETPPTPSSTNSPSGPSLVGARPTPTASPVPALPVTR